jgi:hypothetical protein
LLLIVVTVVLPRFPALVTIYSLLAADFADRLDRVDGDDMQHTARIEVRLDSRQQVGALVDGAGTGRARPPSDERMLESLVCRYTLGRIDGQAAADEVLCTIGYAAPVLVGREAIVSVDNG